MRGYEQICRESLATIGRVDVPWQVLEASMRVEYGTLDARSRADFRREAEIAAGIWDADRAMALRMAEEI
jgi:hypothetical protein